MMIQEKRKSLKSVSHILFCAIVLMGVTAAVTDRVVSDDKTPADKNQQNEMMAKWMKLSTPGPFHKNLDPLVGVWKAESKFWQAPGMPPDESTGISKNTWIFGGRYVKQEYSGHSMGAPFEGLGLMGYDNMKKKYVSVWVDTLSTGMMVDDGDCDESGKVITWHSQQKDPFSGKPMKIKTIIRIINNNKHTMEMYQHVQGGKEIKSLQIVYTRK